MRLVAASSRRRSEASEARCRSGTGRQQVLEALGQITTAGEEIIVSAVARAAGVDCSLRYRHHDLRSAITARSEAATTTDTTTPTAARLSEVVGEEAFHAAAITPDHDREHLQAQFKELELQILDLRQEFEERTEELAAARVTNRNLAELNGRCT